MADAATTGTLVAVALSGGAGALLGAILGQAVQLHRDRKQREHENDRHERERHQALEDARLARREERYVAALTAVVGLRTRARDCISIVQMWNELRELVEDSQEADAFRPYLAQILGWRADLDRELEEADKGARAAANAAYAVASSAVREACAAVADQSVPFRPQALTESGPVFLPESAVPQPMAATEYASRSVRGLRLVIERCNALDQLIRAELRMD